MTDDHHDENGPGPRAQPASGAGSAGPATGGIGDGARRRIGRDLRLLYGSVLDQPLPERFSRLIDDLAAGSKNREGSR